MLNEFTDDIILIDKFRYQLNPLEYAHITQPLNDSFYFAKYINENFVEDVDYILSTRLRKDRTDILTCINASVCIWFADSYNAMIVKLKFGL